MIKDYNRLTQQLDKRRMTSEFMDAQGLTVDYYYREIEKELWAAEHSGAQLRGKDRKSAEYKKWRHESNDYLMEQAEYAYQKGFQEVADTKIAPMYASRLGYIADSSNLIMYLNNEMVHKSFEKKTEFKRGQDVYQEIDIRDSLKEVTKQVSDNISLKYARVDRNTTQSAQDLYNGITNIAAKDGKVVTWDLETFGKIVDPETGRFTGQRITEFSFGFTTGNIKDGTVADIAPENMYESVIGISEKEKAQYMDILDKFSRKEVLSEGEEVTLHRLALYGHKKTKIKDAGGGIFTIADMAEKKDIHGSYDEIKAGIEKLYNIGVKQKATKVNGMYGWERKLLDAVTKIKKEGITAVGFNTSNFDMKNLAYFVRNKDFTTKAFRDEIYSLFGGALNFEYQVDMFQFLKTDVNDRPKFLRNLIAKNDSEYQDGMKKLEQYNEEINSLKQQGDSPENNKLIREKQREASVLRKSLNRRLNEKDKELNIWMRDNDRTALTQEAIQKAIELGSGTKNQNVAHAATEDSTGLLRITFGQKLLDEDTSDIAKDMMRRAGREMKSAVELNANAPKLFYAQYSSNRLDDYGLVSFTTEDTAKGVIRTSDGISIIPDKEGNIHTVSEPFGQTAVRRRTLYQVGGAVELEADNPLYQAVAKAHPEQETRKLYALNLKGQNFGSAPKGTNLNHAIVGTKEQLETYLSQNFIHAANAQVDADGKIVKDENKQIVWTTEGVNKSYLKDLKVSDTSDDDILEHLKEENDFALSNDAAARDVRSHSFAKDKKMMELNDAFAEKYSRTFARIKNMTEGSELTIYGDNYSVKDKQLYRNGIKTNFNEVMKVFRLYRFDKEYEGLRKDFRERGYLGVAGTNADKEPGIFTSIFGFGEDQGYLYPEQFRKAQAHSNFIFQNKDVYRKALDYAERKGKGDSKLMQMYYQFAMERLEEKSNLTYMDTFDSSMNDLDRSHLGWTMHPRINAEKRNLFEVNLQGFRNLTDKKNATIKTFDLKNENSGYSIAGQLFRALGYSKEAIEDNRYQAEAKIGVLMDFQRFLARTSGVSFGKDNRIHTTDAVDIASQKILNGMRVARAKNPQAGILTPSLRHDIVNSGHENFGLTGRMVDSVLGSIENTKFYSAPITTTAETLNDGSKKYKYSFNPKSDNYKNYKSSVVSDLLNHVSYRVKGIDLASDDEASFVFRMVNEHGVSKADAERMKDAQKLARKSLGNFLGDFVDTVSRNGGSILIDKTSHTAFVADPVTHKQTELRLPTITEGHNGVTTIRRGMEGAARVNQLGLIHDSKGIMKVGNQFDEAYGNTGWALRGATFERTVEKEGLGEALNKSVKTIFKTLNELSIVQNENGQEFVMANSFDFNEVSRLLKDVSDSTIETIKGYDNVHSEVFVKLMQDKDKLKDLEDLGSLAPHELSAVTEFLPHIMKDEGVLSQFSEIERQIIKNTNWRKVEKPGFARQYDSLYMPGEYSHTGANKIDSKLAQAVTLDVSKMQQFQEEGYGYVGAPLETEYSAARAKSVSRTTGREIATNITTSTLSINTQDLQMIFDKHSTEEEQKSVAFGSFAGASTDEGSALSDARAEDLVFKDYLNQTTDVKDLVDSAEYQEQYANGIKQKDGRVIQLSKTTDHFERVGGKYRYVAGDRIVVNAGDKLFTKYSNYGKGETVDAKTTGFLKQGWFSDGVELTEDKINELIDAADRDFSSPEEVANYLLEQGYSKKYRLEALNISGTPKIAQADEKIMVRSTRLALGTADEKIKNFLNKNLGFENVDHEFNLVGKFLDYDVIDELQNFNGDSKEFAKTKFYLAIQNAQETAIRILNKNRKEGYINKAVREGVISPEEALEQINKTYGDASGFGKAILSERYAGSDLLQEILHRAGITAPDKKVAIVSNIGPGIKKHGSVSAVNQIINNLKRIDQYGSESGKKEFFEQLKQNGWDIGDNLDDYAKKFNSEEYKGIVNKTVADILQPVSETLQYKDGKLLDVNHGQDYGYNTKAIKSIAERFFDNGLVKTNEDGAVYSVTDFSVMQLPNVDRPGIGIQGVRGAQEMRYNERVAHNIRTHILSQAQVEGILSDDVTKRMIASSPLLKDFEDYLKDSIGKPYLDETSRKLAEHVFYTDGENRVYDKYVEESKNAEDLKTIEAERKAVYEDLRDKGMTTKQIDTTIEAMKKNGAPVITGDRILSMHTAASYGMAREYNRGAIQADTIIGENNFRSINIADANDAKELNSMIDKNALRGQAFVLDFKDNELMDLQVGIAPEKRFGLLRDPTVEGLAVPFLEIGAKNEKGEYISSGVSGKVSRIIDTRQSIIDRMKVLSGQPNVNYEDDEIINAGRDAIQNLVGEIRSEISKTATKKNGIFGRAATSHLRDGVTYLSAEGFEFSGTGSDGRFSKLQFNGINLSEQAKKFLNGESGMDLDFTIVNTDLRNKFYSLDRLTDTLGGDQKLAKELQENVFSYLETGSTLSNITRHPTQQNRSTGASALFFSDNAVSGHMYINQRRMEQMKGDFDSDRLFGSIVKARANITLNGQTMSREVDYATYNALLKMSEGSEHLSVSLHEDDKHVFLDAQKDIMVGAKYSNPAAKDISELTAENTRKRVGNAALSVDNFASLTWDGEHTINYARHYTPEQETVLSKDFKSITESFQNSYTKAHGADAFKELKDSADTYQSTLYSYAKENNPDKNVDEILHFGVLHQAKTTYNEAVMSKGSAGILNDVIYKMDRTVTMASQIDNPIFSAAETNLLRSGFGALQEATLTGKNEKGFDIERVMKLNDISKNMFASMMGIKSSKSADVLRKEAVEFFKPIFVGRAGKEFARSIQDGSGALSEVANAAKELYGEGFDNLTSEQKAEASANLMGDIVSRVSISKDQNLAFRNTVSKEGIEYDARVGYMDVRNSPNAMALKTINTVAQDTMDTDAGVMHKVQGPQMSDTYKASQQLKEHVATFDKAREESRKEIAARRAESQSSEDNIGREIVSSASTKLQRGAKRVAGMFRGHAGISAIAGVAAGLVTAGYASPGFSNHAVPTPATTQAAGASTDEQEMVATMSAVPTLSDANMNVMRGGPNSGYVININATSPEGKDAAVAAVKNAASGMTPQTGSINVSVNTSASDSLNQLQVNRMVAQSLGIA